MARPVLSLSELLGPGHWPTWAALASLRSMSKLPHSVQMQLGAKLGRAAMQAAGSRRNTAATNLKICLPELSDPEREALLVAHFESVGKAIFETAICWWADDAKLPAYEVVGREHLEAAAAKGQGILLVSAHFTSLELGGRMLAKEIPLTAVYRQHENPVLERQMSRNRTRRSELAIPRHDTRGVMRALKQGKSVWYAIDQAKKFGKSTALVPFFGEPANTVIVAPRIAKSAKAAILPFYAVRASDDSHYKLIIHPPIAGLPSADPVADTAAIIGTLEQTVREYPEQYLWLHKRFKNRDEGLPDPY